MFAGGLIVSVTMRIIQQFDVCYEIEFCKNLEP